MASIVLPDEIINKIFQEINTDTLTKCLYVSKKFYSLALDQQLWKKICIRYYKKNLLVDSLSNESDDNEINQTLKSIYRPPSSNNNSDKDTDTDKDDENSNFSPPHPSPSSSTVTDNINNQLYYTYKKYHRYYYELPTDNHPKLQFQHHQQIPPPPYDSDDENDEDYDFNNHINRDDSFIDYRRLYYQIDVLSFNGPYFSYQLVGHSRSVTNIALGNYTIDEKLVTNIPSLLVSGSNDCTVRVWDIQLRQTLLSYTQHQHPIIHVKILNLPILRYKSISNNSTTNPFTQDVDSSPTSRESNRYYSKTVSNYHKQLSVAITTCTSGMLYVFDVLTGYTLFCYQNNSPIHYIDVHPHAMICADRENKILFWKIHYKNNDNNNEITNHRPIFTLIYTTKNPFPNSSILSLEILNISIVQQQNRSHSTGLDSTTSLPKVVKKFKGGTTQLEPSKIHLKEYEYIQKTMNDIVVTVRVYIRAQSSISDGEHLVIQEIDFDSNCNDIQSSSASNDPAGGINLFKNMKWFYSADKGTTLSASYDGSSLVASFNNNTIKVFNDQSFINSFKQSNDPGVDNNTVGNYKPPPPVEYLCGHTGMVSKVQFDRQKIVSLSTDNTIKIWSRKNYSLLQTLKGHRDGIITGCYQGTILATGSHDNTIRLFDFSL
eukprot:gene3720-4633_t